MLLYHSKYERVIPKKYSEGLVNIAKKGLSAKCGIGPHNNGFGIAWITEEGLGIYKSIRPIWEEELPSRTSLLTIIHARKLSIGRRILNDTQPFFRDGLILTHNGTIFSFKRNPVDHIPQGGTDSEKFLCILADIYDISKDLLEATLKALKEIELATAINLFIVSLDEKRVLVVNLFYKTPMACPDYFTLWMKVMKDELLIASEPLDEKNWIPLSTEIGRPTIVDMRIGEPQNYRIIW